MALTDQQLCRLLDGLKARYGSLAVAHVELAIRAEGVTSVKGLARRLDCSRTMVRNALEKLGRSVS